MCEHDYVSKRSDEERKKRSNYKAIIEHDGLPSRQSSNQVNGNNMIHWLSLFTLLIGIKFTYSKQAI